MVCPFLIREDNHKTRFPPQHNHPETPGWVLALSILFWGPMLGNLTTPGWFDIVQLT